MRDKVVSASFLLYGIEHPLSKWEVREYMDVVGCVRNGVRGLSDTYKLGLIGNEERRCGLRVMLMMRKKLPLDLQRWLLFWTADKAFITWY